MKIWAVLGDKVGDNAQLLRLVNALELPYSPKLLAFQAPFQLGKPRYRATLDHLDTLSRDCLHPPWPQLIFTVGRRPAMVATWIRHQHPSTRLILLGRPKRLRDFDWVVCPRYYRLPPDPRVISVDFPLFHPTFTAHDHSPLAPNDLLPRPWTALFIGGPTTPYRFDEALYQRLCQLLDTLDGTVWLVTSRRTPLNFIEKLSNHGRTLNRSLQTYIWGLDDPNTNPFKRLLRQADRFLVTADSVSMATEVARLGKPLLLIPLTRRFNGLAYLQRLPGVHHLGLGYPRELAVFHQALIDQHYAAWLGQPWPHPPAPLPDELPAVIAQLRHKLNLPSKI